MIPPICGLTFTSLRGSIFPVIIVVFFTSFISGVNSLYTISLGCDFCHRNTKVPMKIKAMMVAIISFLYFFILFVFFRCFVVSIFEGSLFIPHGINRFDAHGTCRWGKSCQHTHQTDHQGSDDGCPEADLEVCLQDAILCIA